MNSLAIFAVTDHNCFYTHVFLVYLLIFSFERIFVVFDVRAAPKWFYICPDVPLRHCVCYIQQYFSLNVYRILSVQGVDSCC